MPQVWSPGAHRRTFPPITLKNTSTVNGATLDIVFFLTLRAMAVLMLVNVDCDEVAAMIQVTTLDYGEFPAFSAVSAIATLTLI